MRPSENRRRLLAALGAGAFAVTAGCADQLSGDDEGEGQEEEEEEEEEAEAGIDADLQWSTEEDWNDAQGRTGVVSSTMGGRDADTLSLGYDPSSEPVSEFDSFWPLDEGDAEADTFADLFGDVDLTHDPDQGETSALNPAAPGMFGGSSVEFGGEDTLLGELPVDPGEDWTMGVWVWLDTPEDWACAMMMETLENVHDPPEEDPEDAGEALGLLPTDDPPAFKIGSVGRTDGRGSPVNTQQWHLHVIRYQADHNLAEGYLDGELDYPIQPEEGEEWVHGLENLTLGLRRAGSNNYPFNGRLDLAFATQGLVSEEDIQRLYEAAFEGRLVTAAQSSSEEAASLEVAAEVPIETAASVTVHQDTNGDGESDHSQSVNLSDDAESYGLDGFEAADDGAYWIEIGLQTSDPEITPHIGSVGLAFDG
jgi:hypothetical protein